MWVLKGVTWILASLFALLLAAFVFQEWQRADLDTKLLWSVPALSLLVAGGTAAALLPFKGFSDRSAVQVLLLSVVGSFAIAVAWHWLPRFALYVGPGREVYIGDGPLRGRRK